MNVTIIYKSIRLHASLKRTKHWNVENTMSKKNFHRIRNGKASGHRLKFDLCSWNGFIMLCLNFSIQWTNEAVEHQHWEIHHIWSYCCCCCQCCLFYFIIHLLLVFHDLWLICIWILKSISLCSCTLALQTQPNPIQPISHQIVYIELLLLHFRQMKIHPFLPHVNIYCNPMKNYKFQISSINKFNQMTQ